MRKIISAIMTLTLLLQLGSFAITTVSADTTVTCTVSASAGNAVSNISVSASASSISPSYNSNNIYTTQDVTFTATSTVGSGLVLDYWQDSYGNKISQDSVYTQALAASVDYKAYYASYTPGTSSMLSTSNFDNSTSYNLTAAAPVKATPGTAVSVSASIAVPKKYDVVEAGAVFYEGMYIDNFSIFNSNAVKVPVSSITKSTSGWLIKQTTGSYTASYTPIDQYGVLSRAYCIYTDESSNLYIRYTEPQYTRPDTDLYNNVKSYDVVFNWEMLATFTGAGSDAVHSKELHQSTIQKVATSEPDLITVTPQMYRMNLYPTEVEGEGFAAKEEYLNNHPEYEIDYYLMSTSPTLGKTWYDRARDYIYIQGKDPTLDVIEAVNASGADCFINYRMNDHHNTQTDKETPDNDGTAYPTHSAFWLENEDEYGVSMSSYRVLNYMAPHIRDHYYQIIEELVTKYGDYIEGVELDFDRYFTYFSFDEASQGKEILSQFVARIRDMLNRVGVEKGKYYQLSVRVAGQTAKCDHYGTDALTWDARGYVDLIALSNHYFNTMDIDIEAFKTNQTSNPRAHAKINGEIHYNTYQTYKQNVAANGSISSSTNRRYMTKEGYFATAWNFLNRGSDGIHLFNVLYSAKREELYPELAVLGDKEALAAAEKCYIMQRSGRSGLYDGAGSLNSYVGFQKCTSTKSYNLYIPDDMSLFTDAVLRLEYITDKVDSAGNFAEPEITVAWGSDTVSATNLDRINTGSTELFPALASNEAYPTWQQVAFYRVPMSLMESSDGIYNFKVTVDTGAENGNGGTITTSVESAEFALYNRSDDDTNEMSDFNPGFANGESSMTVTDTGATVSASAGYTAQDGDGYVLSVTNRTSEIAGGKFENVPITPGNLYVVSAFAKLPQSGTADAVINVEKGTAVQSGNPISVNGDGWTRVYMYYDLTEETGETFNGSIYVTTPGSTADILLDHFELFKVEPYSPVAGNIYADRDTSFESGTTDSWMMYKADVTTVQADPFPHSGKWAGYSYNRNANSNTSQAAGLQIRYIDVLPDTYYYVSGYGRTDNAATTNGTITMQFQLVKSGADTVSSTGGDLIKRSTALLDNNSWERMDGIFKTITEEELEASYPGYRIQGKVFAGVNVAENLYVDDFAAVPICINDDFKAITPKEGIAAIEMTIPLEFTVSKTTLSTNVGTISNIERNGTKCTVTLTGLDTAGDGQLTFNTSQTVTGSADAVMSFRVNDPNDMASLKPGFADGENNMTITDTAATASVVETDESQDGDGYVLSVTNRTSEIAGGKFEEISFIPGKLYVVSAFAKLTASGEVNASINVERGADVQTGNAIGLLTDNWTRVFMYYDLTESEGEEFTGNIYITTPGSTADILLDNYQLFEVEPYSPVEGNIYGDRNTSFELGTNGYWVTNKAKSTAIQADPFPHSGKWSGYSYDRSTESTSNANGFQTSYVNVPTDTYYYVSGYVRTGSSTAVSATIPMQFQLTKSGASNVSNQGGKTVKSISAQVDNTKWTRIHGLYKTITDEELEASYSGYQIKAKIYPSVVATENVYIDDFAAIPLCINNKIVSATDGVAVLSLTVPVEFEVTTDTLTTNLGTIESIEREGISCTVTLRGLNDATDGQLTLVTSDVVTDAAAAVMSFKVSGYSVEVQKDESGQNVSCVFRNYTDQPADVRLAIVAYDGKRVVDFTFADSVTVASFKAGEAVTLPLYTSGDRVELLVLKSDTIAPYTIPYDCTGL
ncbi:MAG: hypothetical protein IJ300_14820 [Clostridia bacterium]|nr:hypothetical protein [Clostridia bacterium]